MVSFFLLSKGSYFAIRFLSSYVGSLPVLKIGSESYAAALPPEDSDLL